MISPKLKWLSGLKEFFLYIFWEKSYATNKFKFSLLCRPTYFFSTIFLEGKKEAAFYKLMYVRRKRVFVRNKNLAQTIRPKKWSAILGNVSLECEVEEKISSVGYLLALFLTTLLKISFTPICDGDMRNLLFLFASFRQKRNCGNFSPYLSRVIRVCNCKRNIDEKFLRP